MKAKILNFPEALRLASILCKNYSIEEIGNMTPPILVYSMVELANEEDIEFILSLCDSKSVESLLSVDLPYLILENEVLSLVEFYKKVGGI